MQDRIRYVWYGLVLAVVLFFLLFGLISYHYTNLLWFESHGQSDVWWKTWSIKFLFYGIGWAFAFIVYYSNFLFTTYRLKRNGTSNPWPAGFNFLLPGVLAVFALLVNGSQLQDAWQPYILATYSGTVGVTDPIFNQDASFYMFQLGWYNTLLNWMQVVAFVTLFETIILYFITLRGVDMRQAAWRRLVQFVVPHAAVFLGIIVLLFAAKTFLGRYDLIFDGSSERVSGASYVDVNATIPALTIFFYVGLVAGLVVAISGFIRNWKFPLYTMGAWLGVYILLVQIYPGIVKALQVNPNEFSAEKEFIEHDIGFTRMGYGLDRVDRRKFEVSGQITGQTLARNRLVVDNVRLWDYRPILATFRQLQEIRQYYEFVDVDVDRYNVNGDTRQVLLAARELNLNDLPAESLTWESRHLQYTHGYGVAMSPTNVVTGEGLPELWIKDFPPQTTREGVVELTRPGIYYGELSDDYICVDTHLKEIDYPLEENFAETTYDGKGGIELGTGLRKLLIAWRFDTWKLLISEYIKTESRILFNRRLDQAVETLAPFLVYDDDPYIVVREDGTLAWMIDAYTISDRFPYSAHFKDEILFDNIPRDRLSTFADHYGMNYIRNSVKVVIDAYDGTVDYYVFDPEDPVLRAWSSFFPGLFKSMKEMPEDLRSHLRYPENLFMVQSAIYTDYHMDDPLALMRREDRWEIARELYSGNTQQVEPYYTVIKLPGRRHEEYILMLPFIPSKKNNMIAWMAARCDYQFDENGELISDPFADVVSPLPTESDTGPDESANQSTYASAASASQLLLYDFGRQRQTYGPLQIESRIDQDPEIKKDLALWNQQGSSVIRGNLLVIPIDDSILYVEPLYLQSSKSPFPELRRVIVADSSSVVMEEDLESALYTLSGSRVGSSTGGQDDSGPASAARLTQEAKAAMRAAQGAAARQDWAEFGRQMDRLQNILNRM